MNFATHAQRTQNQSKRLRNLTLLGAAALGALLAPRSAWAQSGQAAAADNPATDATAPQAHNEGEIVVTARRKTERLQDVPVAVSVVSSQTMQNYAISDVQAITKLVPSMVVGRQVTGSSASIFLRGVGSSSLSSGFDQSVSMNVDGIPMSRGREVISTQYDLDRVEVLKGPQALFFGRNSTAGVVSITTRDPGRDFEASGKVGYEFEANEMYGEGVVSGPLSDSFGARIAVRASKMDGWLKNAEQSNTLSGVLRSARDPLPQGNTFSGRATLKFAPEGAPFDITLKGQYTQIKDTGAGPYERKCGAGRTVPRPVLGVTDPYVDCNINGVVAIADVPPEVGAGLRWGRDGKAYTDHKAYYTELTANYHAGDVTLTSLTSLYGFKQYDLASFGGAGTSFVTQFSSYRQFAQEMRAVSDFAGPVNFTAGAIYSNGTFEFDTDAAAQNQVLTKDPVTGSYASFARNGGFKSESVSAFGELSWNIVPTLELAGGARWTHENRDSYVTQIFTQVPAAFPLRNFTDPFKDNNVSPQATLTWKATPNHTLYAAYKEGFKSGGYNTSIGITAAAQQSDGKFASEKVRGFEIGSRNTWLNGRMVFNVTAYDYDFLDLQVQAFDAVTFAQRVTNAGSLKTKGVEAQLDFHDAFTKGFDLHADAAYNDATYGTFTNASCYTGQTIAQGCKGNPNSSGVFVTQDLTGRRAPKAPLFSARAGASYTADMGNDYMLFFAGDAQYSSSYNYTDTLRPDGIQDAYVRYDATIRLTAPQDRWSLALIGRNLTNEWVVTSANDVSGQGAGGTGTNTGLVSDLNTIVDRGRQLIVELGVKF